MRNTLNNIIDRVVKNVLNEATVSQFKMGDSIVIPGDETYGRKVLRDRYKMNPDDFEYIGAGKFVYKMKPKKTNAGMKKKPKFKSQDLGKKDGETSEEYLDRVKQVNQKFAQMDGEIEGEEWRPIENKGRYFKGNADFSKDFEVSNMGRVRVIDLEDPMRSIITSGYDAPNKKARQITIRIPGMRTTPPLHTLVADAWLPEPPGGIEKYYVAHIDGDYHNNRADNLEYRPKKRSGNISDIEEPTVEMPLPESVRRIIKEGVRRALNEVSGWTLEKDDVTWVNDAESGASDKAWMVRLWSGSGYYLPAFGAYATSEEDALEKVVAYLDQEGDDSFFCDDYVEQMKEELAQEGKDDEDIWQEIDEQFCYVDSTMDGGGCHYVLWENLAVYPYDEKRFR